MRTRLRNKRGKQTREGQVEQLCSPRHDNKADIFTSPASHTGQSQRVGYVLVSGCAAARRPAACRSPDDGSG